MATFACELSGAGGFDLFAAARQILDRGFPRIVLEAPIYDFQAEHLLADLPRDCIAAIALFQPLPRGIRPPAGDRYDAAAPFDAAAAGAEARRDAKHQAEEALEFADRLRAPWMRIAPVELGPEVQARRRKLPRDLSPDAALVSELRAVRALAAQRRLDGLRGLLSSLLEKADRRAVGIVLVPGGAFDELPNLAETAELLREFRGAPLRAWLDARREEARGDRGNGDFGASAAGEVLGEIAGVTLPVREDARGSSGEAVRAILESAPVWSAAPERPHDAASVDAAFQLLKSFDAKTGVPEQSKFLPF